MTLVVFKAFDKRAYPVIIVCPLTGGGAFTTNDRGFNASLVT